MDNARYYHADIVKEFIKEHPRIVLKFLPPYSPNLNIIEKLWEIMKKKAVLDFLENKLWVDDKFKNLLIDNFQIIEPDFSGSYL